MDPVFSLLNRAFRGFFCGGVPLLPKGGGACPANGAKSTTRQLYGGWTGMTRWKTAQLLAVAFAAGAAMTGCSSSNNAGGTDSTSAMSTTSSTTDSTATMGGATTGTGVSGGATTGTGTTGTGTTGTGSTTGTSADSANRTSSGTRR